jgi:hypothetical protein
MKHEAKKVAAAEAKKAVKQHEVKMHAKGGMVARGCGAATKGKKFTRNG